MGTEDTTTAAGRAPLGPRGVAAASLIGTTIEYYDFTVYSTSVVVVLGALFFPAADPLVSSLVALSTIGVGFLARPVGGLLFAHFGDRWGRRGALVVSLVLMGASTVAVGLLPTYAEVGVLAPVLLVALRFVQGLAVGGEWGGAVLLAVEHAPREKRSFYGSFPMFGSPLGILSSAGVIALFQLMPAEQFRAWGWRMPFLLSVVLLAVGLYVRLRVSETTQFLAARQERAVVRVPLVDVLRRFWPAVLVGAGVSFLPHAGYIVATFLPSLATTAYGLPKSAATTALIIASALMVVALYAFGRRLDRHEPSGFTALSGVLVALWAFPAFLIAESGGTAGLVVAVSVNFVFNSAAIAAVPALVARLFPANVRYTGISTAYQLAAVVGGGLLPILVSYLVKTTGGAFWPAAALMSASGLLAIGAAAWCRRLPVLADEVATTPA
ncbi:hypothetical protein BJP25_15415 [Actinokineospora bangkokensis]|uniref:Major facilitator superfamily (MFS) profile domain-containing protein n=2 Tax=Actinokineospora bangkokensis TaxID=1193682 RepID=A0A1Q9LPC5_9PSEU|nr:hypothetical protein BJP25_15415 [Actinokineospora bangkokensis]